MKKITKITAAVSAAALLATGFAGCGNEKENASGEQLTYWVQHVSSNIAGFGDMLMYQEIAKATGIDVEFLHPVAGSTGQEAFTTMLASAELPDMIEYSWASYPGGPDAAIDDEVIIALEDHLEKWAPNYYDYMEGEKNEANDGLYQAQSKTLNGHYFGFKSLAIGTTRGFSGLIMRADLLEKWGMDVPVTIADWEEVFAKAKAEGFSKPFTCVNGILNPMADCHSFNTAFDVGKKFYIENGKVVFGPFQPGNKELTALLADWCAKGYIDRNFITNSATEVEANMTNDISVATFGWVGSMIGKLLPAMEERNPEYDLVGCPYPVMNEGDECRWQEVIAESTDPSITITTHCADVESAMKWCDYLYSEEGNILHSFGVEGDTYTVEEIDGETHYIYTDKILKPETIGIPSINDALYTFMRPGNSPGLTQHPDYLSGFYQYDAQKEAIKMWNLNFDKARETKLPSLSYTDEESSRKAVLMQSYQAKFETAMNEIILGNKSMDEYDQIIADAKKNAFDEIIKIENNAYSRYLDSLKK